MRLLAPILLGLVAVGGFLGLMFFQQSNKPVDLKSGEGVFGALIGTVVSDFSPAAPNPADAEIASFMPEAPEGWVSREYKTSDGEELTKSTYRRSAVVIDGNNTLLSMFEAAKNSSRGAAITYVNRKSRMMLAINKRSDRDMNSLQGSIMTAVAGNMSAMGGDWSEDNWGDDDFARMDGILFEAGRRHITVMANRAKIPINYRTFDATLSGQMSIRIMTNASDADVAALIGSIDIVGLNATLVAPDTLVTPGIGLLTREVGVLATDPPKPSIAYLAYHRLRSGEEMTQTDARLLQELVKGELRTWDQLLDHYGEVPAVSGFIIDFYAERPEPTLSQTIRRAARVLQRSDVEWLEHEEDLLKSLNRGTFDFQEERRSYLNSSKDYDQAIMAIVGMLPLRDEAEEEQQQTAMAPMDQPLVVRRGIATSARDSVDQDCRIELGIRRCVIGSGDELKKD